MPLKTQEIFDLRGKVAVVTGSEGLLGRKFCETLASHGCTVAAIDLTHTTSDQKHISDDFVEAWTKIHHYNCDIANPDQVKSTVNQIEKELGSIHILHNNAATKTKSLESFFAPFEEYSLDTWQQVMTVNIDGMFLMAQAVGSQMVRNQIAGSIIQTSSIYGLVGPHKEIYTGSNYLGMGINTPAVYAASKAAVIGLTKYLAAYWGDKNIRVNCLTPGGISSGQSEKFDKLYSEQVPMGRMGYAHELEAALLFLASSSSSYVTGQNIIVDGGFTIW